MTRQGIALRASLRSRRLVFGGTAAVWVGTSAVDALLGLPRPAVFASFALGVLVLAAHVAESVAKAHDDLAGARSDIAALPALVHSRVSLPYALVPTGGWALEPAGLALLQRTIATMPRLETMVEFGAGSSTVVAASLLKQLWPEAHLFSVEHNRAFADHVRSLAKLAEVEVDITVAPLLDVDGSAWYSTDVLDAALPRAIDLVVIDGPPSEFGATVRRPALAFLEGRVHPGSLILVDDVDRPAEEQLLRDLELRFGGTVTRGSRRTAVLEVGNA